MAKQNDFTKMFADMPNMFDQAGFQDGFKQVADFNEKMTGIAVETASQATDIVTDSAKETFSNTRNLSEARSNPADYAQAFADFAQAQMGVAQRFAEAFTGIAQGAGEQFTDVTKNAGEAATQKAANTAKTATKKAS